MICNFQHFSSHAGGETPSNSDVSTRNLYWRIWSGRSHPWVESTTNSQIRRRIHQVFDVAEARRRPRRVLPIPIVQVARREEAQRGCEDADAAPTNGGQREVHLRLLPPILYRQGASPWFLDSYDGMRTIEAEKVGLAKEAALALRPSSSLNIYYTNWPSKA